MRFKKILFSVISAAFVGVAFADDFIIKNSWYLSESTLSSTSFTILGVSQSDAFLYQLDRTLALRCLTNALTFTVQHTSSFPNTISNLTTGAFYTISQNPLYSGVMSELKAIAQFRRNHGLDFPGDTASYSASGLYYYFTSISPLSYLKKLKDTLTPLQLYEYGLTLNSISSDVSALVPALESHAATVSNLVSQVDTTAAQITNRQAQSVASLQGIENAVSLIGSTVSGLPALISSQSLDTMSIDALGALWLDLKGVDWQSSATPFPDLLTQELVSSGLATSTSDAQTKLSDPAWKNATFVPRVKYSQKKANAIAQLEASGISPPAGKSWQDLEVPELETIFEYNYNTPIADVTEVTTNWLPRIGDKVEDMAGSLSDIRDKVQDGIFEVNVMNWPDDFFGFQVTLSNAFAEAFANLSITGRVIELDEDYKRYRNLYGLNGINAPSFDTVFSNAQFLAVGSPNDVNWWRESQNLLSYIAYYGTYNERIYSEISSTNFLAELAAITNRLSILGDVEQTVRSLTDEAIETGEDLKSTLENLTYYRGVSEWCDSYLQAGDTPDRVHLFDLGDQEFYIDVGQSYAFVDLIHGISTFAITLSWICVLPYMIIWLIDWFKKFADFWAQKIVGP